MSEAERKIGRAKESEREREREREREIKKERLRETSFNHRGADKTVNSGISVGESITHGEVWR